jgi:hypothetical protein
MAGATVLLVPADRQSLALYKTATAGPDGKYAFHSVRSGEYKIFAAPPGALPPGGLTTELLSSPEAPMSPSKPRPASELMWMPSRINLRAMLAIILASLTWTAAAQNSPLSPEETQIIEKAREVTLEYTANLPTEFRIRN